MRRNAPPREAGERERSASVRRVLNSMLAVSLVLVTIKAYAGVRAGSLAVLGGAIDSGLDVLTTLVAIILARVAGAAPDEEHPYGHAKFETLGALAMVAFLSITVTELVRGAVARILGGEPPEFDAKLAVGGMVLSLVIGLFASAYERRRGLALRSDLLLADAAHLRADVWVTVAVLAGLGLTELGVPHGDAWTTLFVSILIARTGWGIIREAVPVLVDQRAVEAADITRVAGMVSGVREVYDVRSRGRPGALFAELTIAVRGGLDVETAHDIADRVENEVADRLGAQDVIVHVEPDRRPGAVQ
jgi:cation diffusion facilitator family transporter